MEKDFDEVLARTARIATDWLNTMDHRPVGETVSLAELRERLGGALPEQPLPALDVVEQLAEAAEPGMVAIPSGRYFGFVIGGGLPAAVAADWLTTVWDQNAGLYACGPAAAVAEEVAGDWLRKLLGLPAGSSYAFGPGCQTAHLTCLAAARHHVLRGAGWNVEENGLAGAPAVRIVVSERRHATIDRVLRRVVDSGEAWLSGTTAGGRRAIRLSVCNWRTTAEDVARTLAVFRRAAVG